MAGLRPGHPRLSCSSEAKTWMPGTRPGMTSFASDPPHHRRREIPKRRRAELRHGVAGLGAQDGKHALDTRLAESAQSPQIRPADTHRLRAHGQCLDDVAAAAKAAVDQDRHAAADGAYA